MSEMFKFSFWARVGIETHRKLYLNYHLEGNKLDLGERVIVGGGRIQVDKGGWRVRCREFPEILPRTFRELSEDCLENQHGVLNEIDEIYWNLEISEIKLSTTKITENFKSGNFQIVFTDTVQTVFWFELNSEFMYMFLQ